MWELVIFNSVGPTVNSPLKIDFSLAPDQFGGGGVYAVEVIYFNGTQNVIVKDVAAKYKEDGKENPNILIYSSDDARNISVRELAILKLAIKNGGSLSKLAKIARSDNSNDLADKFNKEIARSISSMSNKNIDYM